MTAPVDANGREIHSLVAGRGFRQLARFALGEHVAAVGVASRSAVVVAADCGWRAAADQRDDDHRSLLLAILAALEGDTEGAAEVVSAMLEAAPPVGGRDRQLPARYLIALLHDLGVPGSSRALRWALGAAAQLCRATGATALSGLVALGGDPWPGDGISQATWVFARARQLLRDGRVADAYRFQARPVLRSGGFRPSFWHRSVMDLAGAGHVAAATHALGLIKDDWQRQEVCLDALAAVSRRSKADVSEFISRIAEPGPGNDADRLDGGILSALLRLRERSDPASGTTVCGRPLTLRDVERIARHLARMGADVDSIAAALVLALPERDADLGARFLTGQIASGEARAALAAFPTADAAHPGGQAVHIGERPGGPDGGRNWALPEPETVALACANLAAHGRLAVARLVLRHVAAILRRSIDDGGGESFIRDRYGDDVLAGLAAEGSTELALAWIDARGGSVVRRIADLLALALGDPPVGAYRAPPAWLPRRWPVPRLADRDRIRRVAERLVSGPEAGEGALPVFASLCLLTGDPQPALDILKQDALRHVREMRSGARSRVDDLAVEVGRFLGSLEDHARWEALARVAEAVGPGSCSGATFWLPISAGLIEAGAFGEGIAALDEAGGALPSLLRAPSPVTEFAAHMARVARTVGEKAVADAVADVVRSSAKPPCGRSTMQRGRSLLVPGGLESPSAAADAIREQVNAGLDSARSWLPGWRTHALTIELTDRARAGDLDAVAKLLAALPPDPGSRIRGLAAWAVFLSPNDARSLAWALAEAQP